MRFSRKAKIFPGVFLNFSKSGISTTIGIKGASLNVSTKGTYLNVGIPGTGLSHRQKISGSGHSSKNFDSDSNKSSSFQDLDNSLSFEHKLEGEIKSVETDKITSEGLFAFKEAVTSAFKERISLKYEIEEKQKALKSAEIVYLVSRIFIIGFFYKRFKNDVEELEKYLTELEIQFNNCYVELEVDFESDIKTKYENLRTSFDNITKSQYIWDLMSSVQIDSSTLRTSASTTVTRTPVRFRYDTIDIVKSNYNALYFQNANGDDLFLYPGLFIITKNKTNLGFVDLKEVNLDFIEQNFIEQEIVPRDSKIIEYTWAKVNKNGQPDKRFVDNYKIPVVRYGKFVFSSKSGLNEAYSLSNFEAGEEFVLQFNEYISSMK